VPLSLSQTRLSPTFISEPSHSGSSVLLQCWLVPLLQHRMSKSDAISFDLVIISVLRLLILRLCVLDRIVGSFYSLDCIHVVSHRSWTSDIG